MSRGRGRMRAGMRSHHATIRSFTLLEPKLFANEIVCLGSVRPPAKLGPTPTHEASRDQRLPLLAAPFGCHEARRAARGAGEHRRVPKPYFRCKPRGQLLHHFCTMCW